MTRQVSIGEHQFDRSFQGRQKYAEYLASLPAEDKLRFKEQAETDTFFMAREVLWFTRSEVPIFDEDGREVGMEIREGPEWGISPLTRGHKIIVDRLDARDTRKHIEAPRGAYKSTITEAYCVRRICQDPNIRIFYAMGDKDLAIVKSKSIRAWFEGDPVIDLIWGPKNKDGTPRKSNPDRGYFICQGVVWREDMWTVSMRGEKWPEPTLMIGAERINRTGVHCTLLITDDIVLEEHYEKPDGAKRIADYWGKLQPFLQQGGTHIDIGTRKADQDLHSLKLKEPLRSLWNPVVLTCGMQMVFSEDGIPELVGESIWPFMTEDWLRQKLVGYEGNGGHIGFARDYMNECMPTGVQRFKAQDVQYVKWEPWMATCNAYMCTDFATADTHNDGSFSVVAIVLLDQARRHYLLDCWISRGQTDIIAETVVDKFMYWSQYVHIVHVLGENTTQLQAYMPSIKTLCRQRQIWMPWKLLSRAKGVTQKLSRIQRLEPVWRHKRFHIVDSPYKERVWMYHDPKPEILFDPTGSSVDRGTPGLPAGQLIDQFCRLGAHPDLDIPDALSDIEALDENQDYVCVGAGMHSMLRHRQEMEEAGRAFRTVIGSDGRPELVEVTRVRQDRHDIDGLAAMFGV